MNEKDTNSVEQCPICKRLYQKGLGCECGYDSKLLERIGSILEYNGQRMVTHSSIILAIIIGLFSVINLVNLSPIPFSIVYFVLMAFGFYEIYRLKESHFLNMALEGMLERPYNNLIWRWRSKWMEAEKENRIIPFNEFVKKEKERKKLNYKKCPTYKGKNRAIITISSWIAAIREKVKSESRPEPRVFESVREWFLHLLVHFTLESWYIYFWYILFTSILIIFSAKLYLYFPMKC